MARKKIKIDTYIGGWGYGKELLRMDLEGTEKDGAVIEISSLGGSVYHAIDMHNQIAQHGNIEVVFVGPSASAATFLAMSAKTVSMVDNAFMLIHKVSTTIDYYGQFNDDDLDLMISNLQTYKEENLKFDLAVSRIYSKKSGKKIGDILDQMKKNTWITADEALEWGFVDRIVAADEKFNQVAPERMVAMVAQAELPILPEAARQPASAEPEIEQSFLERVWGKIQERLNHREVKPINDKIKMDQFTNVNAILQVDALEGDANGCYLNQGQLEAIDSRVAELSQAEVNYTDALTMRDAAVEASELANARIAELNAQVETSAAERSALQAQVDAYQAAFDAIDPTIAAATAPAEKAAAVRAIIAQKPVARTGNLDTGDKTRENGIVDWETINKLPHNRAADENI